VFSLPLRLPLFLLYSSLPLPLQRQRIALKTLTDLKIKIKVQILACLTRGPVIINTVFIITVISFRLSRSSSSDDPLLIRYQNSINEIDVLGQLGLSLGLSFVVGTLDVGKYAICTCVSVGETNEYDLSLLRNFWYITFFVAVLMQRKDRGACFVKIKIPILFLKSRLHFFVAGVK
jgi:hypothetical protein